MREYDHESTTFVSVCAEKVIIVPLLPHDIKVVPFPQLYQNKLVLRNTLMYILQILEVLSKENLVSII